MNIIFENKQSHNEKHEKGEMIRVYITCQMYLKEVVDWIKSYFYYAAKNWLSFGDELVRRAYFVDGVVEGVKLVYCVIGIQR